jgi:putative molybdopterin biosynthesis protein
MLTKRVIPQTRQANTHPPARSPQIPDKLKVTPATQAAKPSMESPIQTQLSAIRRSRGIGAAPLAKEVGVSRQTIYAIEAGSFVPNTEVALKLARALQVSVEALFSLAPESKEPEALPTELLIANPNPIAPGQAVKICEVGPQRISVPVTAAPYYLPDADGILANANSTHNSAVTPFADDEAPARRLLLAGCDPAIGFVSRLVEQLSGVELISAPASSKVALNWLHQGKVHIAGSHLEDPESGEFNLPYLRQHFPAEDFAVVTFARWEEGFVVAPGNPKSIHSAADLAQPNLQFINREEGSGSRALLDRLLSEAKLPANQITGYQTTAPGHLAVAYAVLSGQADCCIATRSAAKAFQLHFIPLKSERYDFILRRSTLLLPAAQTFLDVLQRAALRRKLEVLAGYDTTQTGATLA